MSNQPSFLWHDYETFGANVRSDRPSQFAAIRTDADLNEIGEPINIFCRPSPDYIPHPEACLLTGITPQYCQEHGLSEHAFAEAVRAAKAVPGTIAVGYNSMKFDAEVTRFLLWRNLIEPYGHEWQNQCGRWDLMPVVIAAYAMDVKGIHWPVGEDGKPSFRLELLTRANGLAHDAAYDALSDVRATIALARLVRDNHPALFQYCLSMCRKDNVKAQFDLANPRPVMQVTRHVAPDKGCLSLVMPLAKHPGNANEIIVWDLSEDPSQLLDLTPEEIKARVFVRNDELPEGVTRLPLRTIKVNCAPIVISKLDRIKPEVLAKWGFDMDRQRAHADIAISLRDKLSDFDLWKAVYQRNDGPQDVDEDLYGSFLPNRDRGMLDDLRSMEPALMATAQYRFIDPRLEELVLRYRGRNWPETLTEDEQVRWQAHVTRRVQGDAPGARSIHWLQEQLAEQRAVAGNGKQELLDELSEFASGLR